MLMQTYNLTSINDVYIHTHIDKHIKVCARKFLLSYKRRKKYLVYVRLYESLYLTTDK